MPHVVRNENKLQQPPNNVDLSSTIFSAPKVRRPETPSKNSVAKKNRLNENVNRRLRNELWQKAEEKENVLIYVRVLLECLFPVNFIRYKTDAKRKNSENDNRFTEIFIALNPHCSHFVSAKQTNEKSKQTKDKK